MSDFVRKNKKLIYNPVLTPPWKYHGTGCENEPPPLHSGKQRRPNNNNRTSASARKIVRDVNIETLKTRFPRLRNYQVKGALRLAKNNLNQAIVLLEISNAYSSLIGQSDTYDSCLTHLQVNLLFSEKTYNPTMQRVEMRSKFRNYDEGGSGYLHISFNKRVGVVIYKTRGVYRARML